MTDTFDFDTQLEFGKEWEQQATDHLQELLATVSVSNIDFNERPELQRAGIDSIFSQKEATVDIKTQRFEHTTTGNLPIEVMSVIEQGVPGWFWEGESDMIVWVYPNQAATNLHHTGYLMPLTDGLRDWFDENAGEFRFIKSKTTGRYGKYHTGCRLVPIDRFPNEYLVSFDPRLPTDRETPQSDLTAWSE